MKQEGATTLIKDAPEIALSSWNGVFSSLKILDRIIVVDIGKEDCIIVGKVMDVFEHEVSMLCFSPVGIWDHDAWVEDFSNITGVGFCSHYTDTFTKYLL